jgi:hypothetical protein
MAYGLAGGVLSGYLVYVFTALNRCRRQVETLTKDSSSGEDQVEEAA